MKTPNAFSDKLFDVEHALDIYAYSYVTLPASEIYNKKCLALHNDVINSCHIYFIGLAPIITLIGARQDERTLVTEFTVGGAPRELKWPLPDDANLKHDGEMFWVERGDGRHTFPNTEASIFRLHRDEPVPFNILYIGQAYGEDGNRNAIDRLTKHETLQKNCSWENS